MNMRAQGFFLFVKSCDKVFVVSKDGAADGADPATVSFNTIHAAGDMHKPFFPVKRGKGRGFNPFPLFQFRTADRTCPWSAGKTFAFWLSAFTAQDRKDRAAGESEKKSIAEPQKDYSGKSKEKYLNDVPHVLN
jgi:hypothetical protein